ncbi:hypothetical protein F4678DRAFT_385303 [Xylaria arbuscula]|nr:hypothetical protein F4678DRAFT_385303 [Xylaria arbuscula]
MLYPFSITVLASPPSLASSAPRSSSLGFRKVAQVEDGWRMSHSRDWPQHHLQVAMQVDRTQKRRAALVGRRDGREVTVTCAMSGQARAGCMAGHAVGLRPVSLRPRWQPVRTAQSRRRETKGGRWDEEGMELMERGESKQRASAADGQPMATRSTDGWPESSAQAGHQWGSGRGRWPGC